jgi:hypothetical protein
MRRRATALLGVALAFVLGATVALASHQYGDVLTTSTFHDDIDWLTTSGITTGCSEDPPLYCPNNPVTRGQMAAFLFRYNSTFPSETLVNELVEPFVTTNETVSLTPDGVAFGPYIDGGAEGGSVCYSA